MMVNQTTKNLHAIRKMLLVLLACLLALPIGMAVSLPEADAANETVQVWMTTGDRSKLLQQQGNVSFGPDSGSNPVTINVNEGITYQTIDGFGAAMTGSSAYLMNRRMTASQRDQLMNDLFAASGIRLNMIRHTIGASDFSIGSYTYDDRPAGQTDPNLNNFSIAPDQADVIPMLKAMLAKNGSIKVLGTPWSAPAWMKNNGSLNGGTLLPQYYGAYANYFVKYINAFQGQGIPIYAITVQNEPLHEAGYPSMRMEAADQANFVKNNLGPAFASNNVKAKIIAYDHNWDRPDYPLSVLNDAQAKSYVSGSAFHCYGGNVSAQTQVRNAHPDKGIWFTECSGGQWATDFGSNLKWNMSNLVIGATRNWGKSVLLWNLALDQNHGPTNGGCGDCRGVVTVNSGGSYQKEVEYYILGHASKFVDTGAVRIDTNTFNGGIENVAFKNPDGSIALIALNNGSGNSAFKVKWGTQSFSYTLPAGAVATFKWKSGNGGDGPGAFDPAKYYRIVGKQSGKALDVQDNSLADGGNIQQWTYFGSNNQQWQILSTGDGYYRIMSRSSGKALDVSGVSTADGANVHQWAYVGGDNQKWAIESLGNGYYKLTAKHSGKALDVASFSTADGGNIHQWTYVGGDNQQFAITALP